MAKARRPGKTSKSSNLTPKVEISPLSVSKRRVSAIPEIFEDDVDGEFTPITNLTDLGPAISAIKRGQDRTADAVGSLDVTIREEVKPKLNTVSERTIKLETRAKASEARLKRLENESRDPHCEHEEDFRDIDLQGKQVLLEIGTITSRISVAETNVAAAKERQKEEVAKTDKRWSRFSIALVSVGIAALAGIIGWVVTLSTVSSDVRHLSSEQTKLRAAVSKGTTSAASGAKRIESAARRVESAAYAPTVFAEAAEPIDPLELLWCDLGEREKSRQKRIRGGRIPTKRCP